MKRKKKISFVIVSEDYLLTKKNNDKIDNVRSVDRSETYATRRRSRRAHTPHRQTQTRNYRKRRTLTLKMQICRIVSESLSNRTETHFTCGTRTHGKCSRTENANLRSTEKQKNRLIATRCEINFHLIARSGTRNSIIHFPSSVWLESRV